MLWRMRPNETTKWFLTLLCIANGEVALVNGHLVKKIDDSSVDDL